MIVVFDSNVWQSDLYKRSGPSASVRFFLHQGGGKIAIPEVVRLEVESNLRADLSQWTKAIGDAHRQLLAVFGTLKEIVLPTSDQIEAVVREATSALEVETIEVPFTLESARAAFLKVVRKEPPCDKKQQFKDAVIWHDCLRLAEQDDVTLVTNDKACFQDQSFEKGLARNLQVEADAAPHKIILLSNLTHLLERIRVDNDLITSDKMERLHAPLLGMAASLLDANGFAYDHLIDVTKELFATEQVKALFVKFELRFACVDRSENGRISAVLSIAGDVLYDTHACEFQKVHTPSMLLSYQMPDGTLEEKRAFFISGSIVIGHRDVSNTVRYPLSPP